MGLILFYLSSPRPQWEQTCAMSSTKVKRQAKILLQTLFTTTPRRVANSTCDGVPLATQNQQRFEAPGSLMLMFLNFQAGPSA
jgi:hypothetical protein